MKILLYRSKKPNKLQQEKHKTIRIWNTIFKFLEAKGKKKVLTAEVREKWLITFKGTTVQLTSDFSLKNNRRQWIEIQC